MPPHGKLEYTFFTVVPPLIKVLYGAVGAVAAISSLNWDVPNISDLGELDTTEYVAGAIGFLAAYFAYSVTARVVTQDRIS